MTKIPITFPRCSYRRSQWTPAPPWPLAGNLWGSYCAAHGAFWKSPVTPAPTPYGDHSVVFLSCIHFDAVASFFFWSARRLGRGYSVARAGLLSLPAAGLAESYCIRWLFRAICGLANGPGTREQAQRQTRQRGGSPWACQVQRGVASHNVHGADEYMTQRCYGRSPRS